LRFISFSKQKKRLFSCFPQHLQRGCFACDFSYFFEVNKERPSLPDGGTGIEYIPENTA